MLQQGRTLRPWSMSQWLEGRHPDPFRVGFFTAGPGEPFAFLCPRASVPPLLEPESMLPRWSRDFWDTTLGTHRFLQHRFLRRVAELEGEIGESAAFGKPDPL